MYSRFQLIENIQHELKVMDIYYLSCQIICKDVILSQRYQESVKREVSLINMYVLENNIIYL